MQISLVPVVPSSMGVVWQYGFAHARLRLSVGYEHDTSSKTSLVAHAGAHAVTIGNGIEMGHSEASVLGFAEIVSKRLILKAIPSSTPFSELIAGIRLRSDNDVGMTIGAGRGITDGLGHPQCALFNSTGN